MCKTKLPVSSSVPPFYGLRNNQSDRHNGVLPPCARRTITCQVSTFLLVFFFRFYLKIYCWSLKYWSGQNRSSWTGSSGPVHSSRLHGRLQCLVCGDNNSMPKRAWDVTHSYIGCELVRPEGVCRVRPQSVGTWSQQITAQAKLSFCSPSVGVEEVEGMRLVDCKMGQSLAPCDMDQQMRHLWARWHALLPRGHSLRLKRWHMSSSAGCLHRFANGSDATAPRADVVLSSDVRLSSDMAASQTSGS